MGETNQGMSRARRGFHAVIPSPASRPGLEAPQVRSVRWTLRARLAQSQEKGGKSGSLAHRILKNLCLKLLTFGDYGGPASN